MSDDLKDASTPSGEQNISPAKSALDLLQRTASAISPWVRPWWVQPVDADPAAKGAARVPGQSLLALRIQRSVAFAAHPGGSGELADRFSHAILQRHATADHIGRRYRTETREPQSPAPAQLPLPGVQTGSRIQRAMGEMSLEELARSFQSPPALDATDQLPVQRSFEPDLGSERTQPASLGELQDAARRAAQMRANVPPAASAAAGAGPAIQRAAEGGANREANQSIVAAIEERIRQARQRQAEQGSAPNASGAPAPVQRSPERPSAPIMPEDVGNSIAAAIQARIREARERLASGGTAPTPPVAAPSPAPPALQRAVEPQVAEEVPHELPLPPTSERSSSGYSVAAAVRERIEAARKRNAAARSEGGQPAPVQLQRSADPESPDFSKAAAIRERIEQARAAARSTPTVSTNPDDPNYSKAAAIRERIEAQRLQRKAAESAAPTALNPTSAPTSSPPRPSPPPLPPDAGPPAAPSAPDPSQSIAKQIEARIQAARERRAASASPATPPAVGQNPANPTGSDTAPDGPSNALVQRAPDTRHTVVRDLQAKFPAPGGMPPQAKRVRALSRSQILTPERKTGDFLAGETPKPGALPPRAPSSVQRTIDVTPTRATAVEASPPSMSPATAPTQTQGATQDVIQDVSPSIAQHVEHVAASNSAGDTVQRTVAEESLQSSTVAAPSSDMAGASQVQRQEATPPHAPDAPSASASQDGQAATLPDKLPVQRATETPPMSPAAAKSALESVQRTSAAPAQPYPAPARTSAPPIQPVADSPAAITTPSTPDRIQREPAARQDIMPTSAEPLPVHPPAALPATIPSVTGEVAGTPIAQTGIVETPAPIQPAVQRMPDVREPATPETRVEPTVQQTAEVATQPSAAAPISSPSPVQRVLEAPKETTPEVLPVESSVQRTIETPVASSTATPASTPSVVQRMPEISEDVTPTPVSELPAHPSSEPPSAATEATPSSPQRVRRKPANRDKAIHAPEPVDVNVSPVQQRPSAAPTEPGGAVPEAQSVQRTPVAAGEVFPLPASERLSEPPVQRSAETPAISAAEALKSVPQSEPQAPATPPKAKPLPPGDKPSATVQRSTEKPASPSIATTPAQETALHTPPADKDEGREIPPTTATVLPDEPAVQRFAETPSLPAPPVAVKSESRTDGEQKAQRTPAAGREVIPVPASPAPVSSVSPPVQQQVQRAPLAHEEGPVDKSTLPSAPSVQRSIEATAEVGAATMPAPQPIQQATDAHKQPDATAAIPPGEPRVQRLQESPATTAAKPLPAAPSSSEPPRAESTPPVPDAMPVQRPVEVASAVQETPAAIPPASSQPESGIEATTTARDKTTLTPTPVLPNEPPVQRTVEASAPTTATPLPPTQPPPRQVSEPPPHDEKIGRSTTSSAAPPAVSSTVPPVVATQDEAAVQRTTGTVPSSPDAPVMDAPQRTQSAPVAREAAVPAEVSDVSDAPPVQRTVETPAVSGAPQPLPMPDTLQRSTLQRSIEVPEGATPPSEERVQRAAQTPSALREVTPPETPATPAPAAIAPQSSTVPQAAASETVPPATVQRTPVSDERTASTAAAAAPNGAPVQRSPEPGIAAGAPAPMLDAPESIQRVPEASADVAQAPSVPSQPSVSQAPEETVSPPPAATVESRAPESVQRTPEAHTEIAPLPSAAARDESSSPRPAEMTRPPAPALESPAVSQPPRATGQPSTPSVPPTPEAHVQRSVGEQISALSAVKARDEQGEIPRSVRPVELPAQPSVQRAPQASPQEPLQRVEDTPPFKPVNRYHDPRVLARSVEPNQPALQVDLPVSGGISPAVLPQARLAAPVTVVDMAADEGIQRMAADLVGAREGRSSVASQVSQSAPRTVQRTAQAKDKRSAAADRKGARSQPASSRTSSVRRAPLPLAKLRTAPDKQTVQRQDDKDRAKESFLGATAATGERGSTQPENLGGISQHSADDSGRLRHLAEQAKSESNKPAAEIEPPNLDLLARAIVPVVKRMLMVERERRISR